MGTFSFGKLANFENVCKFMWKYPTCIDNEDVRGTNQAPTNGSALETDKIG